VGARALARGLSRREPFNNDAATGLLVLIIVAPLMSLL